MMVNKLRCCQWIALSCLITAAVVFSKHHDNIVVIAGNPANDIVDIINKNRTSQSLSQLNNSPGLGCIALQYVEQCKGNCSRNNTLSCRPLEVDFTEIFAPNCGVELPTFGTLSGHIVGCQHKYLKPSEAFSHLLVRDKRSLSLLRNKTHTEVGVGLIGSYKHKGPYFWCVLFSDSQANSTFALEDLGQGIKQKKGCYSGTSFSCSWGHKNRGVYLNNIWPIGVYCFYVIILLH
ncbi:hypothetical protein RJ640_002769 [Escallonia rubra]|uniref:Uncharacterized protein n=1 Tax=Escallonia rubra TaxID=112253 RepID=A0AA88QZA4_9ASTE|nr:hypothetical protein RJ640_002769 [Escallonia rubra]